MLGDPSLAVTKPAPDSSWPIGTGAYWATSATTTAQEIRAHTTRGDTLVFKFAASGDARDLLDAGVDLLITRDRALRDYAATLQNHTVVALPWDRTYVFVTAEAGSTRFDAGGLEQAVRAEARRAEGDAWWRDLRASGGKDWGYVVALPRVTADACRSAKDLVPTWPASFTALVDTRPTAIVRRDVARWTVDQDGTVHLAP